MGLGTSGLGDTGLTTSGVKLGGAGLEVGVAVVAPSVGVPVNASQYFLDEISNSNPGLASGTRLDVLWRQNGLQAWDARQGGTIRQYDVSPAWSIVGSPSDWTSVFETPAITNLRSIWWSPDGTVFSECIRVPNTFMRITTFDQSATPFDITVFGASTTITPNITGGITPQDHVWSDDGLRLWIHGPIGITSPLLELAATIPFTASSILSPQVKSFDFVPTAGTNVHTFAFSNDGLFLYVMDGQVLSSYDLGIAFDIDTTSNFTAGPSVPAANVTIPRGLTFRDDNADIFTAGDQNQRRMAWFRKPVDLDITDFSFVQRDTPLAALRSEGISFSSDVLFMTSVNNSSGVRFFDLTVAWDPSSAINETVSSFPIQGYFGVQYSIGGGLGRASRIYVWRGASSAELLRGGELPTPGDLASMVNLKAGGTFGDNPLSGDCLVVAANDQDVYVLDSAPSRLEVHHHRMSTPGDASTSTLQSGSAGVLDISPEFPTGRAAAMCYTPLGTKLFICNSGTLEVFQYDMTVAFDVSTAVYSGKKIDLASSPITPNGMHVRDDTGRTLFISTGGNVDFFVDIYTG